MWGVKESLFCMYMWCIAINELYQRQKTNLNNSTAYSYITLFPTVMSIYTVLL